MAKRNFKTGKFLHIYQNTNNGFLLFYSASDFLVFFTIFCTMARKYQIQVLCLCLMADHIHALIRARNKDVLAAFVQNYSSVFTRVMKSTGTAACFNHPFGSAPKSTEKSLRTALAYIYNNPVEKALVYRAEEYPWNFLAHMYSRHPFSEPLIVRRASYKMKKAIRNIDATYSRGTYLRPAFLRQISENLSPDEKTQLSDYIVHRWSVIDYQSSLTLYKSKEDMLNAFSSNTGSEYEIRETYDSFSHRTYYKMNRIIRTDLHIQNVRVALGMSTEEKIEVARKILLKTGASIRQICKFLHLPAQDA